MTHEERLREKMIAAGLDPQQVVASRKFERFGPKKSQWYWLGVDGDVAHGAFGDWRQGVSFNYSAGLTRSVNPATKEELKRRQEKIKAQQMLAKEGERVKAKQEAQRIWGEVTFDGQTDYMRRKQIDSLYGAGISGQQLIIPLVNRLGQIEGLQRIYPDGEKYFLSGQRTSGLFHVINPSVDGVIYLCEGYSTGASIAKATGSKVVCAMNWSNMAKVAEKFPGEQIVICADNDWEKKENVGLESAKRLSEKFGYKLVYPNFGPDDSGCSDFNDLHLKFGIQAVRETIVGKASVGQETIEERIKRPFIHQTISKSGNVTPKCTIENVKDLLQRVGASVRYNVISKETEIEIQDFSFLKDKGSQSSLLHLRSIASQINMPLGEFDGFVHYLAAQNHYNPVKEWILSKPWDGISRLNDFYSTIRAVDEDKDEVKKLKETLMKRWMISAVAAAFGDGVSAHGVLVLQGDQYLGKTKWFKELAPAHMKVIADGVTLNLTDKDSRFSAISKWLVELGEIDATFKKSDIAALKAFLTQDADRIRRPYDRTESNFARRTVFFGSVNEFEFLHDPTGNRRYWTISCSEIKHNHGLDMQQIWAEFATLFESGESYYLSHEELISLNAANKNHQTSEPMTELLLGRYDWRAPKAVWSTKNCSQIAIDLNLGIINKKTSRQIGQSLYEIDGQRSKKVGSSRVYLIPPKKNLLI